MIEDLINKLKEKNNEELTIEEIRTLYEFDNAPKDYSIENNLYNLRKKRNIYNDIIKIIDPAQVALNKSDLSINTVAYIGDLDIDDNLEIYNLKYVFGNINTDFNKQNNMENLEKVFGVIYMKNKLDNIKNIEWLENIDKVYIAERKGIFDTDRNESCIKKCEYGNVKRVSEDDKKEHLYISCSLKYDASLYKDAPLEVRNDLLNTITFLNEFNNLNITRLVRYIPKDLFSNYEFVEAVIYIRDDFFLYASDQIKNDKDFIINCLNQNLNIYNYISDNLKSDEDIIITALNNNPYVVKDISNEIINSNPKVKSFVEELSNNYFNNNKFRW